MGVDLKLLIVDGRLPEGGYSHTIMEFGRHYDLFDKLNKKARTIPGFVLSSYVAQIPDGSWKDESGYGDLVKTPYGEKITYVSAKEFLQCVAGSNDLDQFARACVGYVRELNKDTLIALWYH